MQNIFWYFQEYIEGSILLMVVNKTLKSESVLTLTATLTSAVPDRPGIVM